MLGTLKQVFEDMENGVYNFCQDGKCIGCGKCCSNYLPVSTKEVKEIKRYVKKHHLKEHKHLLPVNETFDMTCPFLDDDKDCDKCDIYPVRPQICKIFQCNQQPSAIEKNKFVLARNKRIVDMRETFFESEENKWQMKS